MEYREKLGHIALGAVFMEIAVLAAGTFAPLVAQSQSDANFDKITCKQLEVVDAGAFLAYGSSRMWTSASRFAAMSLMKYSGRT